jgi:hypothetical protein
MLIGSRWICGVLTLAMSVWCVMSGAAYGAQACSVSSPAHRVALVELYSSEGCSSCPLADHWLSQWRDGGIGAGVVPLTLHVDYWDGLGWTDRFAQHRFAERQRELAAHGSSTTVYTPEVFVAGREMRDWAEPDRFTQRVSTIDTQASRADLTIRLEPGAERDTLSVDAQFGARAPASGSLNAYLVFYENRLVSQISAGENRGETLHHDRVVRKWIGPMPLVAGAARIRHDFPLDRTAHAAPASDRFGVAAFVEDGATGDVLQAADLAACG